MNFKRMVPLAASLSALALVSACNSPDDGAAAPAGDSEGLLIVSAIAPYDYLATEIAGEHAEIEGLLGSGGDAHSLELSPRQVAAVTEDADVVMYQQYLTPAVDDAVAQGTQGTVLNAAEMGEHIPATPHDHGEDGHDHGDEDGHDHGDEDGHDHGDEDGHDHGDEDGHDHGDEDGHDHGEDGHDHGPNDPHSWLNMDNMVVMAEALRDELVAADPDNAATYEANTETVIAELQALDTEFTEGLADCEVRAFVPSHAAFGHMAEAYDLEQIPVRGLDSTVEPSAARIAEIQTIAQEKNLTTIFYEDSVSPAVSESIANDADLETSVLNDGSSLPTDPENGTDFPSIMRNNLENLREANSCA